MTFPAYENTELESRLIAIPQKLSCADYSGIIFRRVVNTSEIPIKSLEISADVIVSSLTASVHCCDRSIKTAITASIVCAGCATLPFKRRGGYAICGAGVVIFTIRLPESYLNIKICTRVLRLTAVVGLIRYFTFNYHFLQKIRRLSYTVCYALFRLSSLVAVAETTA